MATEALKRGVLDTNDAPMPEMARQMREFVEANTFEQDKPGIGVRYLATADYTLDRVILPRFSKQPRLNRLLSFAASPILKRTNALIPIDGVTLTTKDVPINRIRGSGIDGTVRVDEIDLCFANRKVLGNNELGPRIFRVSYVRENQPQRENNPRALTDELCFRLGRDLKLPPDIGNELAGVLLNSLKTAMELGYMKPAGPQ